MMTTSLQSFFIPSHLSPVSERRMSDASSNSSEFNNGEFMTPNSLTSYQVPCSTPLNFPSCEEEDEDADAEQDFDDEKICRPYVYNPDPEDIFTPNFEFENSFKSKLEEVETPISTARTFDTCSNAADESSPTQTPLFQCPSALGEGSFGKITKARYIHGQNVAIKTIKKAVVPKRRASASAVNMLIQPDGTGGSDKRRSPDHHCFIREAAIHSSLEVHQNIVTLFGCIETPHCVHLLLECVEGGDLEQELQIKFRLSPRVVAVIAHQLFAALTHIHRAGIAHLDIKPGNILLLKHGDDLESFAMKAGTSSSESILKVCDFGQSRVTEHHLYTQATHRHNNSICSATSGKSSVCEFGEQLDSMLLVKAAALQQQQQTPHSTMTSTAHGSYLPPRPPIITRGRGNHYFNYNHSYGGDGGSAGGHQQLTVLEVDQAEPFGTEGYLPPEQLSLEEREGGVKKISTAADIWAAGACLYRCCTGVIPFRPSRLCLTQDVAAKMSSEKTMAAIGCPKLCPVVPPGTAGKVTISMCPSYASMRSSPSNGLFPCMSSQSSFSCPPNTSLLAATAAADANANADAAGRDDDADHNDRADHSLAVTATAGGFADISGKSKEGGGGSDDCQSTGRTSIRVMDVSNRCFELGLNSSDDDGDDGYLGMDYEGDDNSRDDDYIYHGSLVVSPRDDSTSNNNMMVDDDCNDDCQHQGDTDRETDTVASPHGSSEGVAEIGKEPTQRQQQLQQQHQDQDQAPPPYVEQQQQMMICSVCHTSDCCFTRKVSILIEKCVVVDATKRTTARSAFTCLNNFLLDQ